MVVMRRLHFPTPPHLTRCSASAAPPCVVSTAPSCRDDVVGGLVAVNDPGVACDEVSVVDVVEDGGGGDGRDPHPGGQQGKSSAKGVDPSSNPC